VEQSPKPRGQKSRPGAELLRNQKIIKLEPKKTKKEIWRRPGERTEVRLAENEAGAPARTDNNRMKIGRKGKH
jgi:hypothetical protein